MEEKTHKKITNLISTGYFKFGYYVDIIECHLFLKVLGKNQFDSHLTHQNIFNITEKTNKEIDFMNITKSFPYYEDEHLQVLGLPYKGDEN